MTDHQVVRLLADLIHIFTRMETTMAVNFDALNGSIADLKSQVELLKTVPTGGSVPAASVDEAAIQASVDEANARIQVEMAQFKAELSRLLATPAPAPAPAV